jgi:putative transposase
VARAVRIEYSGAFYHVMALFQAHDEKEARRFLDGGLAAAGLSARELDSLPGSDVRKVALASLILERTVARQSWIADKLAMRSAANVSQQVRRYRARRSRLPLALKEYLRSVKIC